jgi:hypothetical protein
VIAVEQNKPELPVSSIVGVCESALPARNLIWHATKWLMIEHLAFPIMAISNGAYFRGVLPASCFLSHEPECAAWPRISYREAVILGPAFHPVVSSGIIVQAAHVCRHVAKARQLLFSQLDWRPQCPYQARWWSKTFRHKSRLKAHE